jgi:hypothetical protein
MKANLISQVLLFSLLSVSMLLAGCGKDSSETTGAGAAAPSTQPAASGGGGKKIAVIAKSTVNAYWKAVEAGARQAAAETNVQIVWTGPDSETLHSQQANMVDNMVASVEKRLKDRDMGIELTPAAKSLIAVRGFDPVMGARPLRRALQRDIEDHLAEKILFGELKAGEIVVVDVADPGSEFPFTFTGNENTSAPDAPPVEFDGIIDSLGESLGDNNEPKND